MTSSMPVPTTESNPLSKISFNQRMSTCELLLWASPVAQLIKNLPAVQETRVQSLGWEDPLEKGKATHSSILAWRTPWTVYSPWGREESTRLGSFHFTLAWDQWSGASWKVYPNCGWLYNRFALLKDNFALSEHTARDRSDNYLREEQWTPLERHSWAHGGQD